MKRRDVAIVLVGRGEKQICEIGFRADNVDVLRLRRRRGRWSLSLGSRS